METPDKKNNGVKEPASALTHQKADVQHAAERRAAEAAHEQAEHDIGEDPDLSIHSPNDDLDEGETSRLGEDITGII